MSLLKSKKSLAQWFYEYAQSHQNLTNKKIHYLCVPVIFLTIVAFLFKISVIGFAVIAIGVLIFYLRLSLVLFGAMTLFMFACTAIVYYIPLHFSVWIAIFVVAWIGQFIGHKIEGAKPSFFQDLQFLLIGPAWVAMMLTGNIPQPIESQVQE